MNFAYDIEVYPNLFCVIFFNVDSKDSPKQVSKGKGLSHPDVLNFVYSPEFGINDLERLEKFLLDENTTLIGFNNLYYDTPVLDYVLTEHPDTEEIFEFSVETISRLNGNGGGRYRERNFKWDEIDLMKAYAFDALGVSLKQVSINLQWWRVQDLPFAFDEPLSMDEIATVLDYNLNDVLITAELYNSSHEMMTMRKELSMSYGIDFRSASDSRMANLMLNKFYADKTGIPYENFSTLRTERKLVWLRNCLGKNISFKTKKLQDLLKKIMNSVVVQENNFAFKESIEFGNCSYEIGVGGLHSVDSAGSFRSDDEYLIQDADVASFYPNIILINNIIPAHLDSRFIEILRDITKDRIEAKHSGNKIKADGLKITVNSIFGKLNSETFWLQDAKAMLSVTLSGQLYLLMLIEELMLNGIMTISSNTDGIICRIPRSLIDKYNEVCKSWQEKTGFELEYTPYSAYHRIDVNNYITEISNGKTKEKGRLLQEISLKKGYRYPVVPLAIYQYLINGIPVIDTLRSCNNVLDFCISQKSGGAFYMEFHEGENIISLQKNNRFFVSNETGGKLIKRNKQSNQTIGLFVSENVTILNDHDETKSINSYDINYSFYEEEAYKYIEEIETSKFDTEFRNEEVSDTVFDVSSLMPISDDVKIVAPKFRFSSGTYRYDERKNVIYRGIATIKFITDDVAERLYQHKDKEYSSFFNFLIHNKTEIGLNSRQIELLIKVNFFSEFGKNKKLLEFFQKFNSIYKINQTEKTVAKKTALLNELWNTLPDESFSVRDQINTELEILGFVQSTFNVNKMTALVLDIDTTYSPKLKILLLRFAEVREVKIQSRIYNRTYKANRGEDKHRVLSEGDFFILGHIEKKQAVRKGKEGEEEWPEIPGVYNYWVNDYEIL